MNAESMNTDENEISYSTLKKNIKSAMKKSLYKEMGLKEYYKDQGFFKLLFYQEAEKIVSKFDKKLTRHYFFMRKFGAVCQFRCSFFYKEKCKFEITIKYLIECDSLHIKTYNECNH